MLGPLLIAALAVPAALFPSRTALSAAEPSDTLERARSRSRPAHAARLPLAVTSFGACELEGWLYVLGGFHGRPHAYGREHQSALFMRLDLADGAAWEVLPHDFGGSQSAVLVEHAGAILRVGGMLARNAVGERQELESLASVARYEHGSGRWSAVAEMPAGRSSHAAAVVDGKLYVVGGWNLAGHLGRESEFASETLVLDLASPEDGWESLATPFQRRALAAAALGPELVVVGGMDDAADVCANVDILDTRTGTWLAGPDLPETGFGAAACAAAGRVYATGGSGTVWTWAPGEPSWSRSGALIFARVFGQLVPSAGGILALGGIHSGERVAPIEVAPIDADAPQIASVRLAFPGAARNRWGLCLRDEALFLFGGNCGKDQHDFEREHFTNESWRVDLAGLAVERLADLPVARQSLGAAAWGDGEILAFGGFGWDAEDLRTHASIFAYDVAEDRWSARAELPVALSQFGLVASPERLALYGGLDYVAGRAAGDDFVHEPLSLEILAGQEPASVEARRLDLSLPRARRAHGAAELDGRIYLIGGLTADFEPVEVCDVLVEAEGRFETIAPPSAARISPELVALDGKLYLIGGASDRGAGIEPDPSIEVFDPAAGTWSKLALELPFGPAQVRVLAHRGRLLAISTLEPGALDLAWIDPR